MTAPFSSSRSRQPVTRWTGACEANEHGGFVAYGDYLELQRELEAYKMQSEKEPVGPRWIPVAAEIAEGRIQEVNTTLPIFARDDSGQWFRLDCARLPK
jgi:hypothetical protein